MAEMTVLALFLGVIALELWHERNKANKERDYWRGEAVKSQGIVDARKIPKCMRCYKPINFNEVTMFMCPKCMEQTADVTR